jgi:predicted aspartyl protease
MQPGRLIASSLLCFAGVLAAQAAADVPITIATTGHPTVPVEIAGHAPVTFVLDTGAEQTVLYHHYAVELGLPLRDGDELVGQTGVVDVPGVRIPPFVIDGRGIEGIDSVALPDRADGARLNGIVGLDVMQGKLVDIDFLNGRFALRSPQEDPRKLLQPDAVAVKATRVAGGLLSFDVQVNGKTGTAVLDSGARDTRLNWRFASAAGFSAGDGALPDAGVIHGATNTPVQSKSIELREFVVAGHTLRGLQARAVDLPVFEQFGVADRPALILGFDVLRNARIVIDLSRDVVWFDWAPAAPLAPGS